MFSDKFYPLQYYTEHMEQFVVFSLAVIGTVWTIARIKLGANK